MKSIASWQAPLVGALLTTAISLTGCSEDSLRNDGGPKSEPPVAALVAAPLVGVVPLEVTLDASASSDDVTPSLDLEFRFDLDGDGTWDTPWTSNPIYQTSYSEAGEFTAQVMVRDTDKLASTIALEEPVRALAVPERGELELVLIGDLNADGIVDEIDEAILAQPENNATAIFGPNLDDDDGDGRRDGIDEEVNGIEDVTDLAPLWVPAIRGFEPEEHRVVASIGPEAARDWIRLFSNEDGYPALNAVGDESFNIELDFREDQQLLFEGIIGRFTGFDGNVLVTLELRDQADEVLSSATLSLEGAPVVFPPDTQDATAFFVVDLPSGPENNRNFMDSLEANMPEGISFNKLNGNSYGGDRWVQDSMQTAYYTIPGVDGPQHNLLHLQTNRGSGLQLFLPNEWLASNRGYVAPRGTESSLNYGGNLEIVPPHTSAAGDFPMGRIVVGGGSGGTLEGVEHSDRMTGAQLDFMNAQAVQGPVIEVSSEWLAVGHIDEIFVFLPRKVPVEGRPDFFAVLASPTLALLELQALMDRELGDLVVFEGRDAETTVAEILSDEAFLEYQVKAQSRIDSVRETLAAAVGLTDEDFVEVPVLYESMWYGKDFAVAYNPGIQNLVAANQVLFIPDPEGPIDPDDGRGVWRRVTRDALEATGHQVEFVDVFESYHELMGEAHCGTNFEREPFDSIWWEVAQ